MLSFFVKREKVVIAVICGTIPHMRPLKHAEANGKGPLFAGFGTSIAQYEFAWLRQVYPVLMVGNCGFELDGAVSLTPAAVPLSIHICFFVCWWKGVQYIHLD
jgi:hypothetical protein